MASHGASLKRLASGQGLQYSHACLSAVSVMGGPDGVGRHPIADVSADQAASAPPPLRYNFDNDRRIVEQVEAEIALRQSHAEAVAERKEAERQAREKRLAAGRVRAEQAAELAAKEKAKREQDAAAAAEQERRERERVAAERVEARRQAALEAQTEINRLDVEKQNKFLQFQGIVGSSSDALTRKTFLERYNWDLQTAIAAFFEYDGDENNIPSADAQQQQQQQQQRSPVAAAKAVVEFAFPDGTTEPGEFNATDTLWIAFEWVYGRAQRFAGRRGFSLHGVDRGVFDEAEYDRTLQELGLCPRGRILVKIE